MLSFSYVFKCQVPVYKDESKKKVVEFDLEVCLLPAVEMIGMPFSTVG